MTNEKPLSETSLRLPQAGNPLILVYQGKIPAMKNETRVNVKEMLIETSRGVESKSVVAGVGKPKKIRNWLLRGEDAALSQMESQGFDKIPMPYRVATWTILGFYKAKTNRDPLFIPKNDADNAFTTIQETWKDTIMDDDRQVVDYHVSTRHFQSEQVMHTVSFIWVLPLVEHDYHQAIDIFQNQIPLLGGTPLWELIKNLKQ